MPNALKLDPRIPWLKLAGVNWLGPTIKAGLIKDFRDPNKIFKAHKANLARIKGWTHSRLERFVQERDNFKPICSPELLDSRDVRLVTFWDKDYPPLLREIPDSPVALFVKGKLALNGAPTIAIVGARNGTQMGYDIARDFAKELAQAGFVVVSGLALGIDTYAHRGAVEGGGRTFAVLANGPDIVYPKANHRIREKIIKSGALISEYPPGTIARPWHFPVRNRIISGICIGTLVIEASARSGSLITARLAGEQNREIFAVPGNIRSKTSEGTLSLIQDGATLVTSPDEIIDYFGDLLPEKEITKNNTEIDLSDEERKLILDLSKEPVGLDKLIEVGKWERDRLFSLLLTLEMRNYLIKLPGNVYQAKIKLTA